MNTWRIYPDGDPDNVLFEGSRADCLLHIHETAAINEMFGRGLLLIGETPTHPTQPQTDKGKQE